MAVTEQAGSPVLRPCSTCAPAPQARPGHPLGPRSSLCFIILIISVTDN